MKISRTRISEIFCLPATGIDPEDYKKDSESNILQVILKSSYAHHSTGLKKVMLKRKYRLLMDIVQKTIMGATCSQDAVTHLKIRLMGAIIDRAEVDWSGFLMRRLIEESKRFVLDEQTNIWSAVSTVGLVTKVTELLVSFFPGKEWAEKYTKKFPNSKLILLKNEPLPGLEDTDEEVAAVELGKKKKGAVAKEETEEGGIELGKKKKGDVAEEETSEEERKGGAKLQKKKGKGLAVEVPKKRKDVTLAEVAGRKPGGILIREPTQKKPKVTHKEITPKASPAKEVKKAVKVAEKPAAVEDVLATDAAISAVVEDVLETEAAKDASAEDAEASTSEESSSDSEEPSPSKVTPLDPKPINSAPPPTSEENLVIEDQPHIGEELQDEQSSSSESTPTQTHISQTHISDSSTSSGDGEEEVGNQQVEDLPDLSQILEIPNPNTTPSKTQPTHVELNHRRRLESMLDKKFPELLEVVKVKDEVLDVLVWRDIRLGVFEDLSLVILSKGGLDNYVDYELALRKAAKVHYATFCF
ncbi:hypothetical protein ACS0TY_015626 [Phlomoides rotata]